MSRPPPPNTYHSALTTAGGVPWDPGWHQHAWPSPGVWCGQRPPPPLGVEVGTPADWRETLPRTGPFAGPTLPPACWSEYCSSGTRRRALFGDWRGPPCRCENEAQRAPRVSPVSRGMSLPGLEARPCVAPEPSAHFASRHIQGELGVTRSARAAGQSPLRTQIPPLTSANLPSLHPGEVGCWAGPGHRQLGGQAGDIAFCLRSPWFSPLPPYIPRRSPPVWNVRLKFNVC